MAPTHREVVLEAGQTVVWLDPGMAFGTGHHETTRLALEALAGLDLAGRRVLDVGAGSGLLAIAADRLGAADAWGLDVDPETVAIARANARANRSRARFVAGGFGAVRVDPPVDVLVANLYAELHAAFLPGYAAVTAPGADLLLTGILDPRDALVRTALAAQDGGVRGGAPGAATATGGWCTRGGWAEVRRHRVRVDDLAEGERVLRGATAHHLARVLRARPGAPIAAFDGAGSEALGTILAVDADGVLVDLQAPRPAATEPDRSVTLAPALLKGDKLADVVRMATELGVVAVRPVRTRRCDATELSPARLARWRRVAEEAARQCGRARVPEVAEAVRLDDLAWTGVLLVADPHAEATLADAVAELEDASAPDDGEPRQVTVVTGPEGGLTPEEVAGLGRARRSGVGARSARVARRDRTGRDRRGAPDLGRHVRARRLAARRRARRRRRERRTFGMHAAVRAAGAVGRPRGGPGMAAGRRRRAARHRARRRPSLARPLPLRRGGGRRVGRRPVVRSDRRGARLGGGLGGPRRRGATLRGRPPERRRDRPGRLARARLGRRPGPAAARRDGPGALNGVRPPRGRGGRTYERGRARRLRRWRRGAPCADAAAARAAPPGSAAGRRSTSRCRSRCRPGA